MYITFPIPSIVGQGSQSLTLISHEIKNSELSVLLVYFTLSHDNPSNEHCLLSCKSNKH